MAKAKKLRWEQGGTLSNEFSLFDTDEKLVGEVTYHYYHDGLFEAADARQKPWIILGDFKTLPAAKAAVEKAVRGKG